MIAAASTGPHRWPRRRFWMAVALVFGVQLALLFWLSGSSPALPHPAAEAPSFRARQLEPGEFLVLEDPTFLALPHERTFPGSPGLDIRAPEARGENRPEPPPWLPSVDQFGAEFAQFVQTNVAPPFPIAVMPAPAMTGPGLPPLTPLLTGSTMRIEGELARRRRLTSVDLRAWPGPELLTNTVVQLLVNAQGTIEFAQLGPRGSGSEEADQTALRLARSLRFEPLEPPGPGRSLNRKPVTVGTAVFEWQTLPVTSGTPTNAPP